jgi:glutaminyl-tRNA synthetase
VKATLHWVSASDAVTGEVRLYDRLFSVPDPSDDDGKDWKTFLNPHSLERVTACRLEPSLAGLPAGSRVQFERLGYFCVDPDSTPEAPVFNRTVTLKDTWARIEARGE